MLLRLRLAVCLLVAIVAACQPDSRSITEVEGTLDHHPERPSCHFAPEAIKTVEGEDEVVLIEFTYGGGETWSDPPGQCGEDPGPDLGGVLLAADGVSYGDGVGADGDFVTLRACETMDPQLGDCAYNMPSPVNAIQIDYLLGSTGYLTFDPPISRLSFRVCSSQSHALAAWDSIGNLIVPDTVGPSNGSSLGGDLYCDPEGWEEFGIQASGYDISRVRLRRFDPGFTAWDDMTFRRKGPPGIVCDTVMRGISATCSVVDQSGTPSVIEWRFEGSNEDGDPLSPIVNTDRDTLSWSGRAVASGIVSATLIRSGDTVVVAGPLAVEPRGWDWSSNPNWGFVTGGGADCPGLFSKAELPGPIKAGQHLRAVHCLNGYIDPPPTGTSPPLTGQPASPVEIAAIDDFGPNHGLWYVSSASFGMDNGSRLNPSILPGYTPQDNLHKKDEKVCSDAGSALQQANFDEYNTLCRSISLGVWIQGLWDHEGFGSGNANGHEYQLRIGALLAENDPVTAVEAQVESTEQAISTELLATVQSVDGDLIQAGDPDHVFVRDNYQPMVLWFFNSQNGRFKDEVIDDVP